MNDREHYVIRQVASREELKDALAVLGTQFTPPIADEDRVLTHLLRHYPQDRQLMLVAEKAGANIGLHSQIDWYILALDVVLFYSSRIL